MCPHNDNKDAQNTTVTVINVLLLANAPVLLVPCDSESLPEQCGVEWPLAAHVSKFLDSDDDDVKPSWLSHHLHPDSESGPTRGHHHDAVINGSIFEVLPAHRHAIVSTTVTPLSSCSGGHPRTVLGIAMMIPIPLLYIYACTTCTCHNWPTPCPP